MADCDVLISGGGPAGLAAAARFARLGLRVILAERRDLPQEKCCGDFLHPAAIDELARLGGGAIGRPIRRLELCAGEIRREFEIHESAAVERRELSQRLLTAALDAGALIHTRAAVSGVTAGADGVNATVSGIAFRARWMILAEGAGSETARQLGLARSNNRSRVGISMTFRAKPGGRILLCALPGGYAGLCALDETRAHFAALLSGELFRTLRTNHDGLLNRLADLLPAWRPWLESGADLTPILYQAPAEIYATGEVEPTIWPMGDSAGIHETAFGDGIARALRQARFAEESFTTCGGNIVAASRRYAHLCQTDARRAGRPLLAAAAFALKRPILSRWVLCAPAPLLNAICRRALVVSL